MRTIIIEGLPYVFEEDDFKKKRELVTMCYRQINKKPWKYQKYSDLIEEIWNSHYR